jgi:hypothetical protein
MDNVDLDCEYHKANEAIDRLVWEHLTPTQIDSKMCIYVHHVWAFASMAT